MKKTNIFSSSRTQAKSSYDMMKSKIALIIMIVLILATAMVGAMYPTSVAVAASGNLAQGKTVIANDALNAAPTWQPSNLTDGETAAGGGFSSNSKKVLDVVVDVTIDLGSSIPFSKVVMFPRTDEIAYTGNACNFPQDFEIQASDNADFGSDVTTLAIRVGLTTTKEVPVEITFQQANYRYVRLHVTKLGFCEVAVGDSYVQLAEFEIYNLDMQAEDLEKADAVAKLINDLPAISAITIANKASVVNVRAEYAKLTDTQKSLVSSTVLNKLVEAEAKIYNLEASNSVNISLGKTVTGDSMSGDQWRAANLTDGDKSNCFSSSRWLPQNSIVDAFIIDLGVAIPISRVVMYPRTGVVSIAGTACNFPENFSIQASDNADFSGKVTTLVAKTGVTTLNTESVTVDFTEFTTRYVRLHVTKLGVNENTSDSCVQIAEFEIYSAASQDKIDIAVALGVTEKLKSLPTIITASDAYTVYIAKSMYDNLTPTQKLLIDKANVDKIMKAEVDLIIAVYDNGEAKVVTLLIKKIPSTVLARNAYTINAAKAAYDALSTTQKQLISSSNTTKLNKAVTSLAAIQKQI